MDTIIIFGAKYLIIASVALTAYAFARAPRERLKENLSYAALILPLSYLFALAARALWSNPRPFVVEKFAPLIAHAADNGFPSDHVLLAAALAAAVGCFDRKVSIYMWVLAILIGASRVAAGLHHAIDIVGSLAIALTTAAVARAIISPLWKQHTNNRVNS